MAVKGLINHCCIIIYIGTFFFHIACILHHHHVANVFFLVYFHLCPVSLAFLLSYNMYSPSPSCCSSFFHIFFHLCSVSFTTIGADHLLLSMRISSLLKSCYLSLCIKVWMKRNRNSVNERKKTKRGILQVHQGFFFLSSSSITERM